MLVGSMQSHACFAAACTGCLLMARNRLLIQKHVGGELTCFMWIATFSFTIQIQWPWDIPATALRTKYYKVWCSVCSDHSFLPSSLPVFQICTNEWRKDLWRICSCIKLLYSSKEVCLWIICGAIRLSFLFNLSSSLEQVISRLIQCIGRPSSAYWGGCVELRCCDLIMWMFTCYRTSTPQVGSIIENNNLY